MLTAARNELLTRVEGDAPMGRLLRENYWFPAALSETIVAGAAPSPLRAIGRDYLLFRGEDGKVACFDERCPHRGASLLLARVEPNGLRCIFHGWKYSTEGKCVDAPTEPHQKEAFCARVPLAAHPVREAAGVIWVWLGTGKEAPEFPDFDFMNLPEGYCAATRQVVPYNWVQGVEGTLDSAHVGVLHAQSFQMAAGVTLTSDDTAPIYEFEDLPYGFRYAGIRKTKDNRSYARVTNFVLPWTGMIAPDTTPDGARFALIAVPIDDVNSLHWQFRYNPYRALGPDSNYVVMGDRNHWPPGVTGGKEQRWGQDRAAMKYGHQTGFTHLVQEDFAVTTSQGPIADRSKEFLNSGDQGVVRMRKVLLGAVEQGEAHRPASAAEVKSARPMTAVMEHAWDWKRLTV